MQRLWDIIVGIFMILASLVCQAIVLMLVVGLLLAALVEHFGLHSSWWIWGGEIVVGIALNALTFFKFRRRITAHRMLGTGGGFFLLPRGIYRIAFGRETHFIPPPPEQARDIHSGFDVILLPQDQQAGQAKKDRNLPG